MTIEFKQEGNYVTVYKYGKLCEKIELVKSGLNPSLEWDGKGHKRGQVSCLMRLFLTH